MAIGPLAGMLMSSSYDVAGDLDGQPPAVASTSLPPAVTFNFARLIRAATRPLSGITG